MIRLDREAALEAAAAQDKARAAGAPCGRLAGAPMMHKDMYYRAGKVSTCGSKIRQGFVPKVTATVLQQLDAAGAIDMGTLNMAEFAQNPTGHNAHFGHCHNPWELAYCTGGSSSGSGAGVAARFFTAALGSDTGGSIRLPATLCGVTGLKATQTRVSRAGVMPLSFSADNVGPLVRTARDAARFLKVIAGQDPKDPTSAPEAVPDYEAALTGGVKRDADRGLRDLFPRRRRCAGGRRLRGGAGDAQVRAAPRSPASRRRACAPLRLYALVSRVEGAAIHANWMREHPGDYAIHLAPGCSAAMPSRGISMSRRCRGAAPCCGNSSPRR